MLRDQLLYLAIALASFLSNANNALAAVIYSEDFEGAAVDSALSALTSTTDGFGVMHGFSAATPGNSASTKLFVRGQSSGAIAPDLTATNVGWSGSNFGQWLDNSTSGTVVLVARFPSLTNSGYSISFDYYEPSGFTSGSLLALVTGNTNSLNTTTNRAINLIFGNAGSDTSQTFITSGTNSTFPATVIQDATLDAKHTMQIFGNLNTGGSLPYYKDSNHLLVDNTYDVWLDGTKIISGVDYRNNNAITTWSRLGFVIGTSNAGVDARYLDNILITNDLPVPEPASAVMLAVWAIAATLIRRRAA